MRISTYTLNHFGIVAGTCRELKIAEIIDTLIPPDSQQKVTTGHAAVAMIINGLGFSNRRLYLFPQFFENKPVHLLVGSDLTSDDLNDDTIGRAFDRMFDYGCTELFCHVAYASAEAEKVNKKFGHLDTTTFSVHGDYKSSEEGRSAILITHGHSKQKRPDLKQIFLNLLVSSDGAIPLFMQALNGNSSDVIIFRKTVTEFRQGLKKNLQEVTYWIADSKFYTEETIQKTENDVLWISRVPDNIKQAKEIIGKTAISLEKSTSLGKEGYSYQRYESSYGGVDQRWLAIHSEERGSKAIHTVNKAVEKELEKLQNKVKKLEKRGFKCEPDANKSLLNLQKKAKFHTISLDKISKKEKYKGRGRPPKNKKKKKETTFFLHCKIKVNKESVDLEIKKKAIFIVATNELSENKLTDKEVFNNYKGQRNVERGFRFLKDPLFFASSLFLKKPKRIVALTMIMCLSLLVYSICERKLRNLLKEHGRAIQNQIGKPTQRPTLRWIFELFEDVHYIRVWDNMNMKSEVKNLRTEGIKALRILGKDYMEPYLLT